MKIDRAGASSDRVGAEEAIRELKVEPRWGTHSHVIRLPNVRYATLGWGM